MRYLRSNAFNRQVQAQRELGQFASPFGIALGNFKESLVFKTAKV